MNTPVIGTPFEGGFFAGRMNIDGVVHNLIVAPKEGGEHDDIKWNSSYRNVAGATSYGDGMANTVAMLESGSKLAAWARDLRIDGRDDWYLPSQDELEILYRAFKPTEQGNSLYGRSGINLTAAPPTRPYTNDLPAKTNVDVFKDGGDQAFDDTWYWSSTQRSGTSNFAWCQRFGNGHQDDYDEDGKLRARAVRRSSVIQ